MAVGGGGGRECSGLRDRNRFDCVVSSCRDCRDGGPAMRQCFGKGPEVRRPLREKFCRSHECRGIGDAEYRTAVLYGVVYPILKRAKGVSFVAVFALLQGGEC